MFFVGYSYVATTQLLSSVATRGAQTTRLRTTTATASIRESTHTQSGRMGVAPFAIGDWKRGRGKSGAPTALLATFVPAKKRMRAGRREAEEQANGPRRRLPATHDGTARLCTHVPLVGPQAGTFSLRTTMCREINYLSAFFSLSIVKSINVPSQGPSKPPCRPPAASSPCSCSSWPPPSSCCSPLPAPTRPR